jgi:ribosomal protein S18 acetylase RimI-like enzyme
MSGDSLEIKDYCASLRADFLAVANDYLAGWPYTRPLDDVLLDRWETLPIFQADNILLAYRHGRPVALLHGQLPPDSPAGFVHLLAMRPHEAPAAAELLRAFGEKACAAGRQKLVGPQYTSRQFYGGYVLGCEPYHPHWAAEGTEAFVRAGCRISLAGVILVREPELPLACEAEVPGYEIRPVDAAPEFAARTFSYCAFFEGKEIGHCRARQFDHLHDPAGRPLAQIGHVGTEEAHRGKGLARRMVCACLRQLDTRGAGEVIIATSFDNAPALASYERAGFERRYNINEWSKVF